MKSSRLALILKLFLAVSGCVVRPAFAQIGGGDVSAQATTPTLPPSAAAVTVPQPGRKHRSAARYRPNPANRQPSPQAAKQPS